MSGKKLFPNQHSSPIGLKREGHNEVCKSALLTNHYQDIAFRYQVELTSLISLLEKRNNLEAEVFQQRLRLQIKNIRFFGKKLLFINKKLVWEPALACDIQRQLLFCQVLWPKKDVDTQSLITDLPAPLTSTSRVVRDLTAQFNRPRLLFVYGKKFFDTLAPLAKSLVFLQGFVEWIDTLNPTLSYLAWVFYMPRFMLNMALLLKHTIPGGWMTEEEQALGVAKRLSTQWSLRYGELLNDGVWGAVGLLCCFVLSGPTAYGLTVGLYLFDLSMAGINSLLQRQTHQRQRQVLAEQYKSLETQIDEVQKSDARVGYDSLMQQQKALESYQLSLDDWITYEKNQANLSLAITGALTVAMLVTALPLMVSLTPAVGALVTFVAVAAIVAIRTSQMILLKQLDLERPDTNLEPLVHAQLKLGETSGRLFKSVPTISSQKDKLEINSSANICYA